MEDLDFKEIKHRIECILRDKSQLKWEQMYNPNKHEGMIIIRWRK